MKKLFFLYIFFIFFFPLEEKVDAEIKNKILAKIGNNIITNYDVVNEINTILALSNQSPTKENLARLQSMAFISLKKNIIKKIEVDRYNILDYSKTDLNNYVIGIENNLGLKDSSLQDHFRNFNADYESFISAAITNLKWNSLIYTLYKKQLDVDEDLINSSLSKEVIKQKEVIEYNLSEIVLENNKNFEISNLISSIKSKGFEATATLYSNSPSSSKGGKIGWLSSKSISNLYLKEIQKLSPGEVTNPLKNKNNIVILKLNDKRILEKENLDLERIKNNIVQKKKEEKLNIFSNSHYIDLEKKTFMEING